MIEEKYSFKKERLSLKKEENETHPFRTFYFSFQKEIKIVVGLVVFLSALYMLSHFLMDKEEEPVPVAPIVIIENDTEPTDLLFPVMKEENSETETEVENTDISSGVRIMYKQREGVTPGQE